MLYRTYRPQTFADIEGQQHVVQTLQGALKSNRVGHAYLFSGPRGTGKTTMARLLAKTLNCQEAISYKLQAKNSLIEPCNKCSSCVEINEGRSLDLIEIDAASHTGVDHVRELTDSARVAASSGGYKVFLIDEVHMLSKSAFNALLKTLEEPPSHVVFLLATTEPHKLLDTILSRVQRLDFKKLTQSEIEKKLARLAKLEKIAIEPEAIAILATYGGGSLRDAESALSKLISFSGTKITSHDASTVLGIVPETVHRQLLEAIDRKDAPAALATLTAVHEEGIDLGYFAKQFIEYVRHRLVAAIQAPLQSKTTDNPHQLARVASAFMKARTELSSAPIPSLPLELAIVELIGTPTPQG